SAEMTAKRGEIAALRSWLEALPNDLLHSRVELCLWQGWLLALSGQYESAERLLHDLEPRLRTSTTGSPLTPTIGSVEPPHLDLGDGGPVEHAGRAAAIRAFIAYRDMGTCPAPSTLRFRHSSSSLKDRHFAAWSPGIWALPISTGVSWQRAPPA